MTPAVWDSAASPTDLRSFHAQRPCSRLPGASANDVTNARAKEKGRACEEDHPDNIEKVGHARGNNDGMSTRGESKEGGSIDNLNFLGGIPSGGRLSEEICDFLYSDDEGSDTNAAQQRGVRNDVDGDCDRHKGNDQDDDSDYALSQRENTTGGNGDIILGKTTFEKGTSGASVVVSGGGRRIRRGSEGHGYAEVNDNHEAERTKQRPQLPNDQIYCFLFSDNDDEDSNGIPELHGDHTANVYGGDDGGIGRGGGGWGRGVQNDGGADRVRQLDRLHHETVTTGSAIVRRDECRVPPQQHEPASELQGGKLQLGQRILNSKASTSFLYNSDDDDSIIPQRSKDVVEPNRGGGGVDGDQHAGQLCRSREIAVVTSGIGGSSGMLPTQVGASNSSVKMPRQGFDGYPGGGGYWSNAKLRRVAQETGCNVAPVTPHADGQGYADSELNPASVERRTTIPPHGVDDDNSRNRSPSWSPTNLGGLVEDVVTSGADTSPAEEYGDSEGREGSRPPPKPPTTGKRMATRGRRGGNPAGVRMGWEAHKTDHSSGRKDLGGSPLQEAYLTSGENMHWEVN